MPPDPRVEAMQAQAYTVPTTLPQADETAAWDSTAVIVVHVEAGGQRGIGYTVADAPVAGLVTGKFPHVVAGRDPMDPPSAWRAMRVVVKWFEEPVSSDNPDGLRWGRDHTPSPMVVAPGRYGYELDYFRRMLAAEAVDVQQGDATHCGGVTGLLRTASLREALQVDLSAHCAQARHRHLGCAAPRFRHLEWCHDHVRIEHMLFDGAPVPHDGRISSDPTRPGSGLALQQQDAARFTVAPGGSP